MSEQAGQKTEQKSNANAGASSSGGGVGVSVKIDVGSAAENEQTHTTPEMSESLRSHSVCIVCQGCQKVGASKAEPTYNIINCIFAYFCTEFWSCYMCFKRKDWNCYNARHSCSNGFCNQFIDNYTAC